MCQLGDEMKKQKRWLSLILAVALLLALAEGILPASRAADDGVLRFNADGKFTVMQLTDIQDNADVDPGTISLITRALARYTPDLVVFTGDNIRGFMSRNSFRSSVDQFLAPLLQTGTKYAVTFGNHDEDGVWPSFPGSREEQYAYYKQKGGSLFVDHDVPELDGTGSGAISIYPYGQSADTPAFQIFLMDSGSYEGIGYSGIMTNQIDYYLTTNTVVPCLWFQHIPVPEIYDLLTQVPPGSPDSFEGSWDPFNNFTWAINHDRIHWEFSGSTIPAEIYKQSPGPTKLSTYQETHHRSSPQFGSRTVYEAWLAAGNMRGAYFGHNHMNTFVGTTPDGIMLGYGKAATLKGHNDGDPGCRVFEIDESGNYTTISVTVSSLDSYSPGNYALVNNALDTVRAVHNRQVFYRVNPQNDPNYHVHGGSPVTGGYYLPTIYTSSADALRAAISQVQMHLDSRFQARIDAFAASILSAWNELELKQADYSSVNEVLDHSDGQTILTPPLYNQTHPNQRLPVSFYTEESVQLWSLAVEEVTFGLKAPSQTVVDEDAAHLIAAFNTLILKPGYETPRLFTLKDSDIYVCDSTGTLYGLPVGVTQQFFASAVHVSDKATLAYTLYGGFGTGTKVMLTDPNKGSILAEYYLLLFGDVNGDGNIDSNDAGRITDIANWMYDWPSELEVVLRRAADLNADGNVDSVDADILTEAENWNMNIDQLTGLASVLVN